MVEKIFPSAGRNYVGRIGRGATGSSLFTTKKVDLYASIYSKTFIGVNFSCFMPWNITHHM